VRSDPEQNWNRDRVKGLVAELVDVKDATYATGDKGCLMRILRIKVFRFVVSMRTSEVA